jgi:hypothetical protein
VGKIPGDASARQAWLERWAAEQLEREGQRDPRRARPWDGTVSVIKGNLRRGSIARRLDDYMDGLFDHGLDTQRHTYPEIGTVDSRGYIPSMWHVLPRALRAVGASDRDVLVDFGCGKGRIVHQAASWPLKRVIGVEISPELAYVAQALVAKHRHEYRCQSVEIVTRDATSFQVPEDLTIAYLYEPFTGKTLDAVLHNLINSIDSHPRRLRLIYVYPLSGAQVLATGRFRLVKWQRGGLRDYRFNRAAIFESCPHITPRRSG